MRMYDWLIMLIPHNLRTLTWKLKQEAGAFTGQVPDHNGTPVLFDNTVRNRKAETCPCTYFLCSEEWIKDALFEFRRYTWSSIAEADLHHICRRYTGNGDNFVLCVGHCITRIGQQVKKDLLQLDRITCYYHVFRGKMQYNLYLPEAQLFSYERDCALDDLIDGHRFIAYRSCAAESAEVGNDLRRLAYLLHRAVQLL